MRNKYFQDLYDDIVRELTIYENNEDPEISDAVWLKVFYYLLVKTINYLDCMEEENCDGQD